MDTKTKNQILEDKTLIYAKGGEYTKPIIKDIIRDVQYCIAEIEKKIKDLDIYISLSSEIGSSNIRQKIYNRFFLLNVRHSSIALYNIDYISKEIEKIYNNMDYYILEAIGFDRYKEKNNIFYVREDKIYYLKYLSLYDIDIKSDIIFLKTFKNGLTQYKVKDLDKFNNLRSKLFDYKCKATQHILDNITVLDRKLYKENIKQAHYNKYNAVHDIKNRLDIKKHELNYDLILRALNH